MIAAAVKADPLRQVDKPYLQAVCSLPGCGQVLHIEWVASRPIFLSDNAQDLNDMSHAYVTSWQVNCEAGHTILLPVDSAREHYAFGDCICDPDEVERADDFCGHTDMDRLRSVISDTAVNVA